MTQGPPDPRDAQPGTGFGGLVQAPYSWQPPLASGAPLPPGWGVPAATSGLAIASLVLSILWIGGVGSILAIIFGAVALSRINHSFARLSGRGLAIAGLVIGLVGTVGAALLYTAVALAVHNLTNTTHLSLGQVARHPVPVGYGIESLTVKSFDEPVTPNVPFVAPAQGKELAVIDVQVCAGASGSSGSDLFALALVLPDKATVAPTLPDAMSPALSQIQSLSANRCAEGFVTFQVPVGTRPVAVSWSPNLVIGPTFEWGIR